MFFHGSVKKNLTFIKKIEWTFFQSSFIPLWIFIDGFKKKNFFYYRYSGTTEQRKNQIDQVVNELTTINELQRDFNEITKSQQTEIDDIEENVIEVKDNIEVSG